MIKEVSLKCVWNVTPIKIDGGEIRLRERQWCIKDFNIFAGIGVSRSGLEKASG